MGNDDLSEDELNSLISDLEGKDGGSASGDLDDVDMDSLMEEADAGDADVSTDGPAATELAEELPDDLPEPDLSDLEGEDQVPAESGSSAPAEQASEPADDGTGEAGLDPEEMLESEGGAGEEASSDRKQADGQSETSAKKTGESPSGSSQKTSQSSSDDEGIPWGRWALVGGKWLGYALPIVALVWLVGAYLGQWIRAGWLIGAVSAGFAVGLPAILYRLAGERGKFRWWFAGSSLVLVIGLVAPLQDEAGLALAQYGHWPGEAVQEITGVGKVPARLTGSAAGAVGGLLYADLDDNQRRVALGSPPNTDDGGDRPEGETAEPEEGVSGGAESTDDPVEGGSEEAGIESGASSSEEGSDSAAGDEESTGDAPPEESEGAEAGAEGKEEENGSEKSSETDQTTESETRGEESEETSNTPADGEAASGEEAASEEEASGDGATPEEGDEGDDQPASATE